MVKVRFAPSPTGHLHVGNAKTALMNYLFARNRQGIFLLRIEDTDIERSDISYEASILDDLRWLGIEWDEGPIRQTQRFDLYRSYAELLLSQGAAYKCFCSQDDLETARQAFLKKGEPPRYSGTCRRLSESEVSTLEKEGKPYVVRFKSLYKPVAFQDLIHGEIHFPRDHVDDFILMKQERTPSYNFAVTIDDMEMAITHVIRGADHISNTPKQIMLFEALRKDPPQYAHHSLLIGSDKKPLSKRHGVTGVKDFREMGILGDALTNYLAILGRNVKSEVMEREELVRTFSLESLSRADSYFDMEKLLWLNKEYIRNLSPGVLLRELGLSSDCSARVSVLRENTATLKEMKDYLNIFDQWAMREEDGLFIARIDPKNNLVKSVRGFVEEGIPFPDIVEKLKSMTELKKKDLFMFLRILLTGRISGPPLKELYPLIPKDIILKRIDNYLGSFVQK